MVSFPFNPNFNAWDLRYLVLFSVSLLSVHCMVLYVGILHLKYDYVPLESLIVIYAPMYVILYSWNGILPLQSECYAFNSRQVALFSVALHSVHCLLFYVGILHPQYDCVLPESLIVVYAPMYVILCSWNDILPQSECNACNSRYMASFSVFCSLFIVMLFYVGILHLQFDCVPLESLFVVYVPRYVILSSWNGILPLQSKF